MQYKFNIVQHCIFAMEWKDIPATSNHLKYNVVLHSVQTTLHNYVVITWNMISDPYNDAAML